MTMTISCSKKLDDLTEVKSIIPRCIHWMFPYPLCTIEANNEKIERVAREYDEFNEDPSIEWIIVRNNGNIVASSFHLKSANGTRLCHLMALNDDARKEIVEYLKLNVPKFYTFMHKTNVFKKLYLSYGLKETTEFEPEHGRDPKHGWVKLTYDSS